MRNLFLFVITLFILKTAHAQPAIFAISSESNLRNSDTYSMTIFGRGKSESKSKIPLINGQIVYTDTTSVPLVIRITPSDPQLVKRASRGYYPVKSQSIWLIAMPGSSTTLVGHLSDFSEVYPVGDVENEILTELTKRYFPIINEAINLTVEINKDDNGLSDKEIDTKRKRQKQLNEKAQKEMVSFLKKYPSSIAGLYFLEDTYIRKGIDFSIVKDLVSKVDPRFQDNQFFRDIKSRVEADQYKVGNKIMEIQSNRTPDSSFFTTAAWKDKFYLIDFWGSWCGPCISDFPNVKSLKNDLKDQIEILGIASDQEKNWRRAIESYGLAWYHILIGTGDQDFATLLDVRGYPTKILIDPNGKILYKDSGSSEESFKKIRNLIENWK